MSDPFFYLWAPAPGADRRSRRLQHVYTPFVYSILFALWRFNSLRALRNVRGLWKVDGPLIAINYLWMAIFLPLPVAVGHVLLAGFMSATIVTSTHQTEELFDDVQHDWVHAQLLSTRNAATTNPFSEWLWGGMQYQLEHHLFPTMPRYRYRRLQPIVRQFCADNGQEYRMDGEFALLARNWRMLRDVALAPPREGAPPTRSDTVWTRRDGAAWTGG